MFREFRELIKKEGYRGWRLESEDGEFYLSKFDDRLNDDEFRFYLHLTSNHVYIKRMLKLKSYKKIMKVSPQHDYAKQADILCEKMDQLIRKKPTHV